MKFALTVPHQHRCDRPRQPACRRSRSSKETEHLVRWRIALLVSCAIAISYLDRQTLPVAIKAIGKDIPISNEQFSALQSAFLLSYAFMYAGGGKLVDALGTKRGFALIMAFWSFACASHSIAASFAMLVASRFLLGIGEGGGFPAATRVVAEWFSPNDSATAMGIINGGTAVGAVAAPPLIAVILAYLSWRWIFVFTGAAGLLWTLWWQIRYSPPSTFPQRTSAEPAERPEPASSSGARAVERLRWLDLLRYRESWGLVIAKFLSDAAWYFYLLWLPKYLYDARGFDIKAVGTFAWIPYAASGVGCLVGGWFSSYLVSRKLSVDTARKVALGLSAAVMPSVLFVPHVAVSWALAIFSVAYFGQQSWSTLVMVLPTDLFPQTAVGSVAGLVGFGGAMGGIAFGEAAGYLLDHGFGYGVVFTLAGSLHVIAFIVILLMVPTVRQVAIAPGVREMVR
ncbi:MAG TPA: MFS transporter [Candidatus Acidoferrum sp.]|nr:MFS transporter [Candidatus Acidoferrum sp.]